MAPKNILIVDDELVVRDMLTSISQKLGYVAHAVESCAAARAQLKARTFDLLMFDVNLPDGLGLDLLRELNADHRAPPVIFMTGDERVEVAVEAMRMGARDFLAKPFVLHSLRRAMKAALQEDRPPPGPTVPGLRKIAGDSAAIREVWRQVDVFAPTDITMLLLGESGTGKELFARAIHAKSKRSDAPFVELDCASIPSSLIEAELFGYEKGSFTDAKENRPGKFEIANGGTVFLDEIGNLSLEAQAKLLRLVQERRFRRIGGSAVIVADVRVIAATNLDLEEAVRRGAFRNDLFYRLSELPVRLPSLRERAGDVSILVDSFIAEFNACYNKTVTGLTAEAARVLSAFDWPGNIRELANVVRFAVLQSEGEIDVGHLPPYLRSTAAPAVRGTTPGGAVPTRHDVCEIVIPWNEAADHLDLKRFNRDARQQLEGRIFRHLVEERKLNKAQMARFLGIDYKVLIEKLKPHGL